MRGQNFIVRGARLEFDQNLSSIRMRRLTWPRWRKPRARVDGLTRTENEQNRPKSSLIEGLRRVNKWRLGGLGIATAAVTTSVTVTRTLVLSLHLAILTGQPLQP
jgi:hypothetical protein